MTTRLITLLSGPTLALTLIAGCSSNEANAPATGTPGTETPAMPGEEATGPDDADAAATDGELTEDHIEVIRQLPEADAEMALVQKMCPVQDKPLGSMGVPVKVDVKGRPVYLCCAGCEGAVEEDPDAILAKVPQGGPELPSMGGGR